MGKKARAAMHVHRHHVHAHFSDDVFAALAEFAGRGDLTLNGSVRVLVERGLAREASRPFGDPNATLQHQLKTLGHSALASLIAIEQNQKLIISMLPEGGERAEELWEEAATSARSRLIRIDQALTEETL
ncbi:MAG: hypothetical protein ACYDA0_10165 [Candidatus Dormibacteraceae bacterium]